MQLDMNMSGKTLSWPAHFNGMAWQSWSCQLPRRWSLKSSFETRPSCTAYSRDSNVTPTAEMVPTDIPVFLESELSEAELLSTGLLTG